MIIKVLAENTSEGASIGHEHGLSLYIETGNRRILFDTGASSLFARNAQAMGVDLSRVDFAILSHGHADHGGGLKTFLELNAAAPVYLSDKAFEKHAARVAFVVKDVGLDPALLPSDRFVFTGNRHVIDDELEVFSGVPCLRLNPSGNRALLMAAGGGYEPDDFRHEQNLVIRENGKTALLCGCAHCGIVNILDHYRALYGGYPDAVLGGFHLYNPLRKKSEPRKTVAEIARCLLETKAMFYTGHCTGLEAYEALKAVMGDNVQYLPGGQTLEL
jgi:7,8-dihydropterin-6-yl-methyl-4-(beta-D-ribofuranosyl)aminobenzene 5'-phosphate synthase